MRDKTETHQIIEKGLKSWYQISFVYISNSVLGVRYPIRYQPCDIGADITDMATLPILMADIPDIGTKNHWLIPIMRF